MENKLLLIVVIGCILAGIAGGYLLRGVIDPRYTHVEADTSNVKIVVDSAAIRAVAELRIRNGALEIQSDSLTTVNLYIARLYGGALTRLDAARHLIDSLRAAGDSSTTLADVGVQADTTFTLEAKAYTDSGDVIKVPITGRIKMFYSFLTNYIQAGIKADPITLRLPVQRVYETNVIRQNFLLWVQPEIAYQGGMVGGGIQVGIMNYGIGVLAIPNQEPVYVLSGRYGW